MLEEDYRKFLKMLRSPNGIIYLTGPTGSGKTTTLYLVLEELAKKTVNISTIEDPVEKNLARVNQMQVNPLAGLTFETGLRALLRQDPDIIMVGETRDSETASISVRAALTGHLVFSTLHTNDAASSAIRLKDMGLEPYLIANSMVGVVAQRLMRKVCTECCVEEEMTQEDEKLLGISAAERAWILTPFSVRHWVTLSKRPGLFSIKTEICLTAMVTPPNGIFLIIAFLTRIINCGRGILAMPQ